MGCEGVPQPHNRSLSHGGCNSGRAGTIASSPELRPLAIIQGVQALSMPECFMLS